MNDPTIEVVGNLGGDPDLRYVGSGIAVCDLRVAVTPRRKVGEEWEDQETLWFTATCWRQLAENAAESFRKGDRVVVRGRLRQQTYVRQDGSTGSKMVIAVDALGADISRLAVTVKRPVRAGSGAEVFPERNGLDPVADPHPFEDPTIPPAFDASDEVAA